jgi:hypothetical protein
VITPFGLRHVGLLRQLQGTCTELDLQSGLDTASPLRTALRGYFLGARAGVHTYVLRAADHAQIQCGFVQATVQRPLIPLAERAMPAWRVVTMAPLLDQSADAATIWYRLLLHLCIAAGETGVPRLFACLPECSAAEDVFRQATFVAYCHQQVYWRANGEGIGRASPRVRGATSKDSLDMRWLWHRVTPRAVQQAEEPGSARATPASTEVAVSDSERHFVLRGVGEQLQGCLSMLVRPRGVWLRLIADADAGDSAAEVLDHGLAAIEDRARPVYCAVRDYEGGVRGLLDDRGFAPGDTYSLLVKYTTVRVREPLRKLVPALEKGAEVTPSVSRSEPAEG